MVKIASMLDHSQFIVTSVYYLVYPKVANELPCSK